MVDSGAPVLSTPATRILEEQVNGPSEGSSSPLSDDELFIKYEIQRTLVEIRKARYARIALQFPDNLLPDAPRVFEVLRNASNPVPRRSSSRGKPLEDPERVTIDIHNLELSPEEPSKVKFYILADTSYGACCVDEIAAEHVNADVVVHYGRACLSPTSRIPVIHVFTIQPLKQLELLKDFKEFYLDLHQKIILMADVTFQHHLKDIHGLLERWGYTSLFMTEIVHDPSSPLPNRTVPEEVIEDLLKLREWHLFHISHPPESLLLTQASRLASMRICPTWDSARADLHEPFVASTSRALNKRYAILTSVTTVSVFGILINTLSVKNYLHIVEHIKSQILAAGKKSYTFVVGKINAAKIANFSEIGAWVVIGCWESSLIDSKDFWKPVLTPFELDLALKRDRERVWTGEWSSDFQWILKKRSQTTENAAVSMVNGIESDITHALDQDGDSDPESAPPEFDLRTGRYVSHSRPIQSSVRPFSGNASYSKSLIKRTKGDLAVIGGEASPGAEHLRSTRTWQGLGSDFEIAYEENGAALEQGRSGIARGYTHAKNETKT